jgi:hypothetical protein
LAAHDFATNDLSHFQHIMHCNNAGCMRLTLQYLAEPVDLVVVGPADQVVFLFELLFHELARVAVAGNIAYGKVNSLLDDQPVVADIGHAYALLLFRHNRALVFTLDGVHQDAIGLFRKGKEGQLRIIEEAVDKVELDKHLLPQQLGPVKKDLMVLEIIDVLYLEGRHAYLPDDPPGSTAKLDIVRRYQGLGEKRIMMFLGQHLVSEIKIILVDKTPVKALSFLVERAIAVIRQYPVLQGLFHSTSCFVLGLILDFSK